MNYDIKLGYAWKKKTSIIIKFTLQGTMMIQHWDVWSKLSTITKIML